MMEIWLSAALGILLMILFVLLIKLFLMKETIREIETALSQKLSSDTNTLIDISYQDKSLRRLAECLNTELRKLRRERHRFCQGDLELKEAVTNISHDLRTPLTSIQGYLDLLQREEKSDTVQRYIEVIRRRVEAMTELTEELFQYSVVVSAGNSPAAEPVSVNGVLEESILAFYAVLQQQNITPSLHLTDCPILRNVNRSALSRIFSNLIQNAVKYSGGDLEITLTDDGSILFSNSAPGLSEADAQRLFDRFYTVEHARKSTGLGLSISKILVEQMKGTITAYYRDGRLTVCIQLPG